MGKNQWLGVGLGILLAGCPMLIPDDFGFLAWWMIGGGASIALLSLTRAFNLPVPLLTRNKKTLGLGQDGEQSLDSLPERVESLLQEIGDWHNRGGEMKENWMWPKLRGRALGALTEAKTSGALEAKDHNRLGNYPAVGLVLDLLATVATNISEKKGPKTEPAAPQELDVDLTLSLYTKEIYINVHNNDESDEFVCEVLDWGEELPLKRSHFPWKVKWQDSESRFYEIAHGTSGKLFVARLETSEIEDEDWDERLPRKMANVLFIEPKREKMHFGFRYHGKEDFEPKTRFLSILVSAKRMSKATERTLEIRLIHDHSDDFEDSPWALMQSPCLRAHFTDQKGGFRTEPSTPNK